MIVTLTMNVPEEVGVPLSTPVDEFKFKPFGKSGLRMSELFREMGAFADDTCLVRSMQTDHVLHEAAMSILFTGSQQLGRPSWGSWAGYALGSENKDLPEFVVMLSGSRDGGSPETDPREGSIDGETDAAEAPSHSAVEVEETEVQPRRHRHRHARRHPGWCAVQCLSPKACLPKRRSPGLWKRNTGLHCGTWILLAIGCV